MPAIAQYPPAWVQLRALGEAARRRGLSFEDFWAEAFSGVKPAVIWRTPPERRPAGCVIWANDTRTRADDQQALRAVRDGWERAYLGLPATRQESALPRLSGLLDRVSAIAAEVGDPAEADLPLGEAVLSAA